MTRIFYAGVNTVPAALFLIPVLLVWFRRGRRTVVYTLFALYLAAVCALVGLPNVTYIRFDLNVNLIPFSGMIADIKNCILNVLLFVPLGFFLPCLWEMFRSPRTVLREGFWISAAIELLQIFTFRATDVNDLITNTLGTALGFGIARLLKIRPGCGKPQERFVIYGAVLAVMTLVQPFLANLFWNAVL